MYTIMFCTFLHHEKYINSMVWKYQSQKLDNLAHLVMNKQTSSD